jgi:hypothetical protein
VASSGQLAIVQALLQFKYYFKSLTYSVEIP